MVGKLDQTRFKQHKVNVGGLSLCGSCRRANGQRHHELAPLTSPANSLLTPVKTTIANGKRPHKWENKHNIRVLTGNDTLEEFHFAVLVIMLETQRRPATQTGLENKRTDQAFGQGIYILITSLWAGSVDRQINGWQIQHGGKFILVRAAHPAHASKEISPHFFVPCPVRVILPHHRFDNKAGSPEACGQYGRCRKVPSRKWIQLTNARKLLIFRVRVMGRVTIKGRVI